MTCPTSLPARSFTLCAGLLLCALVNPAHAADPVHYRVIFTPSGDSSLDAAIKQASTLASFAQTLPPAPIALIKRAASDEAQFTTILHSFAYDSGTAQITINGLSPTNPTLLAWLDALPAPQTIIVTVTLTKGPPYKLSTITITGAPIPLTTGLPPGRRANAAPILNAQASLQTTLRDQGYAFATIPTPQAIADPATQTLSVTYQITPGPRVTLGTVSFTGLTRTNPDFLRQHAGLTPGTPYSYSAVQTARTKLLSLGIFSALSTAPLSPPDSQGRVNLIFQATPRKRHSVTLSADYATDTGIGLGTSWADRNLLGRAETLTLSANATGLGGTGTKSPGYDLKADFQKPDYLSQTQSLDLYTEALRADLTAYDRSALILGAGIIRPFYANTTLKAGATFTSERVHQQGVSHIYLLVQTPFNLALTTVTDPLEPLRGYQATLSLTPTMPMLGDHTPFFIAAASGSLYLPLSPRSLIALRAQLAGIYGASLFQVPPDQRLYGGGSGTVRGFTYQTIGPLFPNDQPTGGLSLDAFSIELRQHLTHNIGIVPFIDAGQVSKTIAPFTGHLRVSAGLGLRYYTSIGPIRLDLAFPLNRTAGSGAFALYAGLGEAF